MTRKRARRLAWLGLAGIYLLPAMCAADDVPVPAKIEAVPVPAKIAIIIDDLGYALEAGRRAIALPGPVTIAVLPATPRGELLAELAHRRGKEVLLHLPLQAVDGEFPDEPGRLGLDMTRQQFASGFAANLASVPHAAGVNSHRGSLLTRHPGHMAWLMEEIGMRDDLFFVDSYTTHESVALSVAKESGVPAVKRDVFLDPDREPGTVAREFARLKKLARQRGFAVGIGHPKPETLALLEREIPALAADGFELVSVGELIASLGNSPAGTHTSGSGE